MGSEADFLTGRIDTGHWIRPTDDLVTDPTGPNPRMKVEDGTLSEANILVDGDRLLLSVGISRTEAAIGNGLYYAAYLPRTGISATSSYFYEFTAPLSTDLIIDSVVFIASFHNSESGTLNYIAEIFMGPSTSNSWTYTGGSAPATIGKNMNGNYINQASGVTFSAGGSASVTGSSDFIISFIDYELAAQGSNKLITSSESRFFDGDRRIVVPAGTKTLLKASSTGTMTGTFDVKTYMNFYTRPV